MGHTVWVFGPWSKTVTIKIMAQGCLLSEEESYFGQGNIKKSVELFGNELFGSSERIEKSLN